MNGHVIRELGTKANPNKDRITIDGRLLKPADEPVYLLLHKPVGVVTTLSDPEGRPTIRDVLGHIPMRVFPVGRLDFHSSGLLLLTNDGELAQRLTHPRYGITKVYEVKVRGGAIPELALQRLRSGVELDDGKTAPARVRVLRSREGKTWLEMVLSEGRRREVRRMCEAVGLTVEKLRRVALGPLLLGKLQPGDFRPLSPRELLDLQRAAGLDRTHAR